MAPGIVVGLAGAMGSGKTTLAAALAEALGWPKASFGGYVRQIASDRKLEATRPVLQDLGENLIDQMGWLKFCHATLQMIGFVAGTSLVIDGIRHVEAVKILPGLVAPSRFYCVGIDVPRAIQAMRLTEREHLPPSAEQFRHSTELEVDSVLRLCDLRMDGRRDQQQLVAELTNWVRSRSVDNLSRPPAG